MMTTVKLYGKLGKLFGRTWRLDVNSPREAVCAIDANNPGFAAYLTRNSLPGYHVIVGDRDRDEEELDLATVGRTIKIIPYVKGRNTGWGKIVVGAVLVIVGAVWKSPASPYLINAGIGLMFGGVSQLLTIPPTLDQPNEREKSRPSYSFDGPVNTTAQGWPMSVGYGTLRVGGSLVSMSITAGDPWFVGLEPDTGVFQIQAYPSYVSYVSPTTDFYVFVWVINATGTVTWSITDQSSGDFFSIEPFGLDTLWGRISWGADTPLQDHTLTIKSIDSALHEDTASIIIGLSPWGLV